LNACDDAYTDECVQCVPPIAMAPDTCGQPEMPISIPVDRLPTPIVPRSAAQIASDPACAP
jgi:hypothetical protein